MSTKKIAAKIREDYKIFKSLAINIPYNDDELIELVGMEYCGKKEDGFASDAQIKFLLSLDNVRTYSDLSKTNRWFMSACIQIAKDYPEQHFRIKV
jgi:hypothetical protein